MRKTNVEHTDTKKVLQKKGRNHEAQIARVSGKLSDRDLNTVTGGKPSIGEVVLTQSTDTASNTPLTTK